MAKFDVAVLAGVAPTGAALDVDFTKSGFGTPKAAKIVLVRATELGVNLNSGHGISIGFYDGTRSRAAGTSIDDGVTTSATLSLARNDKVVVLPDQGSGLDGTATASFITDGLRVTFDAAMSGAWLMVVTLYTGDSLSVHVNDFIVTSGTTVNITDPAFEPGLVQCVSVQQVFGTSATAIAPGRYHFGACHNDGTADPQDQHSINWHSVDNVGTSQEAAIRDSTHIFRELSATAALTGVKLEDFDADGFSAAVTSFDSADCQIAYLAMKVDAADHAGFAVHEWLPNQSTGNQADTTAGFTPILVDIITSQFVTLDSINTASLAGTIGLGAMDGIVQRHAFGWGKDNSNNMNTGNRMSGAVVTHRNHQGGAVYGAEFVSFDTLGFTVNIVDSAPGVRRCFAIVYGEELTTTITGSGTGVLPSLGGSGVGSVNNPGSGTGALPTLAATGVGSVNNPGSGTGVLPTLGATGVGSVNNPGSGTGVLPTLAATGVGFAGIIGSGTGALPTLGATAVGSVNNPGSGTGVLPTLVATGVGFTGILGSGTGALPTLAATGVGSVNNPGSGTGALPTLVGSGVGSINNPGSGTGALPSLAATGAGSVNNPGAGTGVLPSLAATGAGSINNPGSGTGALPSLAAAGTGTLVVQGSGTGALPSLEAVGIGQLPIFGSGTGELPSLGAVGVGSVNNPGSGTGALPSLVATGVGFAGIVGSGTGVLPSLGASGIGSILNPGSGTGVLPTLGASGVGSVNNPGAGVGALPGLGANGAGTILVVGSGTGALPTLAGTGTGTIIVVGSGTAPLPSLGAAGVGTIISAITGSGTGVLPTLGASGVGLILVDTVQCTTFLAGNRDTQSNLTGSRDIVAKTTGSYDVQTDLGGSLC